MRPSSLFPRFLQIAFRGLCIFALVAGSVPVTANEPFLNKPSSKWTEAEALQVLNDLPLSRRNGADGRFAFDAVSC
jgi:hypothetical protein